jgi:hypothetical protein
MVPLRHEPFGSDLKAEWRFGVIHERNFTLSMEMPFFHHALTKKSW